MAFVGPVPGIWQDDPKRWVGETSGTISRMFREAGADVATCDLNPSASDSPDTPHFQGDASHIQDLGWDLVICHPPCTYLSNAGVQYLHTEPGRFDRMLEGVAEFKSQHATKAPFVCLEQPKIHGYARQELGGLQTTQLRGFALCRTRAANEVSNTQRNATPRHKIFSFVQEL